MMMRRIFAGSIVALLLAVSSFAAACDLSCAFAPMKSDCHAQQTESQNSAFDSVKMDGMAMDGMTMPDMSGGDSLSQQIGFAPSRTMPIHATVVDMGTCERQSCSQAPVVTVKANHPAAARYFAVCAPAGSPQIARLQTVSHDARDDSARCGQDVHRSLSVSLRV